MALTRMPRHATAWDVARVSPITPAFETEYANISGLPSSPAVDVTLTMRPGASTATQ